jgi:ATP-binding cassette, subfamily F, member 3
MSGGEKARLALAMIALTEPAMLVLDEPTNHLDLDMREALSLALQDYTGALLLVSHDRSLLKRSVDEFWLVEDGRVTSSPATWMPTPPVQAGAPARGAEAAQGTGPEQHDRREERRAAAEPTSAAGGKAPAAEAIKGRIRWHEQDGIHSGSPAP